MTGPKPPTNVLHRGHPGLWGSCRALSVHQRAAAQLRDWPFLSQGRGFAGEHWTFLKVKHTRPRGVLLVRHREAGVAPAGSCGGSPRAGPGSGPSAVQSGGIPGGTPGAVLSPSLVYSKGRARGRELIHWFTPKSWQLPELDQAEAPRGSSQGGHSRWLGLNRALWSRLRAPQAGSEGPHQAPTPGLRVLSADPGPGIRQAHVAARGRVRTPPFTGPGGISSRQWGSRTQGRGCTDHEGRGDRARS